MIKETIILNVFILLLVILANWVEPAAYLGGLMVLSSLVLSVLRQPKHGLFLIFGVKLTYDALWNVGRDLSGFGSVHLLSLFLMPIVLVSLLGPKVSNRGFGRPLAQVGFYLIWVLMATLVNESRFNVEVFIKQASIFVGLLVGLKYIRDRRDFNQLVFQIFLSAIIPVLATIFQFVVVSSGHRVLHFTLDSTRGLRYSGVYYDAATNGMACLMALLSSAYLLKTLSFQRWKRLLQLGFLTLTYFCIVLGATRSMLIISSTALLLLIASDLRRSTVLIPLLLVALYFGKPYIDGVFARAAEETKRQVVWSELLTNPEFRGVFSGRVSVWQETLDEFSHQSWLQQALGGGKRIDAHSSYFFLLMQIGFFGVTYYTLFNLRMLYRCIKVGRAASSPVVIAGLFLLSALLLGLSANVILFTSFQWTVYLVLGGMMNIIAAERFEQAESVRYLLPRETPMVRRKVGPSWKGG